jgi:hypothetical protein
VAVVAALAALAAAGFALYGLVKGPDTTRSPAAAATAGGRASPAATRAGSPPTGGGLTGVGDGEAFARRVAVALFGWDTATMEPADVTGALLVVADPTGQETPGLVEDVGNYLPDQAAWASLRRMGVRQWIDIDTITVPDRWAQAADQAGPGAVAHTVTGTRRREGVWRDEPVVFAEPVAFTVFAACPEPGRAAARGAGCALLRLSLPDRPLD